MVATQDIAARQVILVDKPGVWGPYSGDPVSCVTCLSPWDGHVTCKSCGFPVCGDKCAVNHNHQIECTVLSRLPTKPEFVKDGIHPIIGAVMVVRLLQLRQHTPTLADKIHLLMDHVPDILERNDSADEILVKMLVALGYTRQEVLKAIGIIHTNEVFMGRWPGSCLYPTFSFITHSCISNASYTIYKDRTLVLSSKIDIQSGEEVTIQYISPSMGNIRRRQQIRENWFFDCTCIRCQDSTELGTFLSAVLCQQCASDAFSGFLLPKDALDYSSSWVCSREECGAEESGTNITSMVNNMEAEVEEIGDTDLEMIEEKIAEWCLVLHSQHYLVLMLKRKLLSSMEDCFIQDSSWGPRKVALLEENKRIFDILDPFNKNEYSQK